MNWIPVFIIGVASGWMLELLLDVWFWGRRNRNLAATISTCRSDFQASEKKEAEARAIVSHYEAKEDEFRQCQYDLVDRIDKHGDLKKHVDSLSIQLEASQQTIGQLNAKMAELRTERDHLSNTLEAVDQWVETSMRRRVWDAATWQRGLKRSKARSVAYTRTMVASASSQIGRAAKQVGGSVSTAKTHMGRAIHKSWLVRLLDRSNCTLRGWVGMFNKKANLPQSCSINGK